MHKSGILEVYSGGRWGAVCQDTSETYFHALSAKMICKIIYPSFEVMTAEVDITEIYSSIFSTNADSVHVCINSPTQNKECLDSIHLSYRYCRYLLKITCLSLPGMLYI